MRPPVELPAELRAGPFSIHDAQRAGVRAGRLDARDLTIPFPGVRDHKDAGSYGLLRQCQQFAARIAPWQFFSHGTALALWGAPMPSGRAGSEVHVSAHRPQREPRVKGVIGHRLQCRDAAVHLIGGLPVESPARAWRQAGASWSLDDLVAAGDYLVGRGRCATLEELRCEAAAMGGVGAERLRAALDAIRAGSESSEESRLRLVLARAGLPEPELNWVLRDASGRFVARLDLAYPRWRVGTEYDGRQHAFDVRQFERDSDRWPAIRRAGWDVVRVLRHHLRDGGKPAVFLVREALLRAGWSPSRG